MFYKKNMSELECCKDGMDVIFTLATSPSLMSLLFPSNFRFSEHLRTLVIGPDRIDVIFKLATLDELDDVSNLNQFIWIWLILQGFSEIVILDVGPIIQTVI